MVNGMYNYILDRLPYKSSFRFVDEIAYLDSDKVIGHYTLKKDAFFYEDHFAGNPVTPGAILTEIMAQIGLVVLGIYLVTPMPGGNVAPGQGDSVPGAGDDAPGQNNTIPVFTSIEVAFLKMALPGEKITVISKKDYFRFDKLKCHVEMQDASGALIAKGVFAGIIKKINK
jgi:3-hydroxyacyl-[acyl-carrier-protein] dehydratase